MHQSIRSLLNFQNQIEFNSLNLKKPILLVDAKLLNCIVDYAKLLNCIMNV